MSNAIIVSLPLASHFKLSVEQCSKIEDEQIRIKRILYATAIGSIIYIMVCTKSDLAFVVCVSRFMINLSECH